MRSAPSWRATRTATRWLVGWFGATDTGVVAPAGAEVTDVDGPEVELAVEEVVPVVEPPPHAARRQSATAARAVRRMPITVRGRGPPRGPPFAFADSAPAVVRRISSS